MSAVVCRIAAITKHPNADQLELAHLCFETDLVDVVVVTGPHYRAGQRGVYISPGSIIPGYLAEDLWLCGRGGSNQWHAIETKNMRGIESPGMFCGAVYKKNRDDSRSVDRFAKLATEGGISGTMTESGKTNDWITWPYWRNHWRDGEDVSAHLGIRSADR